MNRNWMFSRIFFRANLFVMVAICLVLSFHIAWAEKPISYSFPKVVYWATGDVGSYPYVTDATMADKMAGVLGSKFRLIPGNDVERLNLLRMGKADLAFLVADLYWASMGLSNYSKLTFGPQPLRVVWSGWPYFAPSTGIASATSGIKTPYDLKGKRVIRVVGAAWSTEGLRAHLAFGNLTLNDVTIVNVSTTGASHKAMTEGKADYHIGGNTAPGAYETEVSPHGIYLVRFPHEDKEGWNRLRKILPYVAPGYATEGAGIKQGEKIPLPMYPMPVTCTLANKPDEFVYEVCKAIYIKIDEIAAAHAGNKAMKPEQGIRPEASMMGPFHPGAIKFFKEIGVWTQVHEAANKKRLAQLEKVNKRWQSYIEEADERMAKTGKKVDPAKEWPEIVEKEIGLLP